MEHPVARFFRAVYLTLADPKVNEGLKTYLAVAAKREAEKTAAGRAGKVLTVMTDPLVAMAAGMVVKNFTSVTPPR